MCLKVILSSLLLFLAIYFPGQAQCGSSYTETHQFSEIDNEGTINIQIVTKGSFECKLLVLKDSIYEQLKKSTGANEREIVFNGLDKGKFYKIEVIFTEEKELCKIRQTGGIKF